MVCLSECLSRQLTDAKSAKVAQALDGLIRKVSISELHVPDLRRAFIRR
jgi:hypothetical protein